MGRKARQVPDMLVFSNSKHMTGDRRRNGRESLLGQPSPFLWHDSVSQDSRCNLSYN